MMNKVKNNMVPDFWSAGNPASNHGGCFWTDGKKLYSYDLMIGDTCAETGAKILRDHTSKGRWPYHSQTTSVHVGKARVFADIVD
jgi:hypothetical protein